MSPHGWLIWKGSLIKYLIADPELETTDFGNGISFNKEFFEENLTQAAYFAEENTTIYKIF